MSCSVYYLFVFSGLYGVQCWWAFLGWVWKQWNTWNSENWIHEPSFNQVELWLLLKIFSLMIAYLLICSFWEFALTDFGFHNLFSVRLNERKQRGVENNKKMAYLVDLKTINVGKWKRHSPEVWVSYGGMGRSSVFTIEDQRRVLIPFLAQIFRKLHTSLVYKEKFNSSSFLQGFGEILRFRYISEDKSRLTRHESRWPFFNHVSCGNPLPFLQ